jgi:FkbM family methyltransferase
LRSPWIRRKIAFEIGCRYFSELGIELPIGAGMVCPVASRDAIFSFSEIFLEDEYGDFLRGLPLPETWLDIGCHAGYFTLYLAREHRRRGSGDWKAMLIEPDPRMVAPVKLTLERNGISDRCRFLGGAVSGSGDPDVGFALSDGMGSSLASAEGPSKLPKIRVPVLKEREIADRFPPPYDLLKIDVEGAEWEFFDRYGSILEATRSLLLEWHLPGRSEAGEAKVREALARFGFGSIRRLRDDRVVRCGEGWLTAGVCLATRPGDAHETAGGR